MVKKNVRRQTQIKIITVNEKHLKIQNEVPLCVLLQQTAPLAVM